MSKFNKILKLTEVFVAYAYERPGVYVPEDDPPRPVKVDKNGLPYPNNISVLFSEGQWKALSNLIGFDLPTMPTDLGIKELYRPEGSIGYHNLYNCSQVDPFLIALNISPPKKYVTKEGFEKYVAGEVNVVINKKLLELVAH